MQYLVWWNPTTWLSDGLEMVTGAIQHGLRSLFYLLDKLLYKLVIDLYNTFDLLCTSRLLDSTILNEISKRIGLLLGIIMLFMVVFSFIKMLVNPEILTDKKTGASSIVKKSLIVIVMLGTSQFLFDGLYRIQNAVINENIISKLILPYTVENSENFGGLLSEEIFTSFYRVDSKLDDSTDEAVKDCRDSIEKLKYGIYYYGDFESGYTCLNETTVVSDKAELITDQEIMIIDYNWLLATGVAIVLIYFMFSYCISVGVRVVQLAVLEIIAPMAIISYISPKDDNMFNKWSKIYISTYIDVFIRIAIINFIVFLISTILSNSDQWVFWKTVGNPTDFWTRTFIMVVMILALLTFAKKAPDLIKDLLPAGASKLGFGISSPKQMFSNMLGGNYVENGLKRGYGAAAVGFNSWQKNTRKALGNLTKDKDLKSAGRFASSLLFGGIGGMRRGLMTTNASGRRQAAANAYAATQSKYKMRDLGYGSSLIGLFSSDGKGIKGAKNYLSDLPRRALMQDQYVEDLASMKDVDIENKRQALIKYRQEHQNDIVALVASKTHDKMYIYQDENDGPVIIDANGVGKDKDGNDKQYLSGDKLTHSMHVAKEEKLIGKATGESKKLHQKAEEQKQKSSK